VPVVANFIIRHSGGPSRCQRTIVSGFTKHVASCLRGSLGIGQFVDLVTDAARAKELLEQFGAGLAKTGRVWCALDSVNRRGSTG
jgi:hypothetical protein